MNLLVLAALLFLAYSAVQYLLRNHRRSDSGKTEGPFYDSDEKPQNDGEKRGGGPFGNIPPELLRVLKGRGLRGVLSLAVLAVIGFAAVDSFYTVPANSQGVIFRLGAIQNTVGQGPHFKIPFISKVIKVPTEKVYRFEFGFRTVDPGPPARYKSVRDEELVLTSDNKIVEIDWVLQFQIADPINYLVRMPIRGSDRAKLIRDEAEARFREVVAAHPLDDILTTGKEAIMLEARQSIQKNFDDKQFGIRVLSTPLQDVTPPDSVAKAFSDVNSARAKKEQLQMEADQYENEVQARAAGEAKKLINDAEAYGYRRVQEATGEAARIRALNASYRLNPELVMNNLWLEGMSTVWKDLDVAIVDLPEEGSLPVIALESLFEGAGQDKEKEGRE